MNKVICSRYLIYGNAPQFHLLQLNCYRFRKLLVYSNIKYVTFLNKRPHCQQYAHHVSLSIAHNKQLSPREVNVKDF